MVFGEVITMIILTLEPVDLDLVLVHSILYPIEPHVHCLGPFDLGALVGEPISCRVVGGDAGWVGLLPSHLSENVAHVGRFLAIVEEGPHLGF